MRLSLFAMLASVLFLGGAGKVHAQKEPAKPTVVIRVNSLDNLIDDAMYLAKMAGQEENAKQIEGFIKAMKTEKGLEGVDTTKPFGAYARLGATGIDSDVVILAPIADEETFLAFLKKQQITFKKGDEGAYEVNVPRSPFPGYFRFANGYVYVTIREPEIIAPANLRKPGDIFAGLKGVGSITINLDAIPVEMKELVLGQIELQIADAKDQPPPRVTDKQKKLFIAVLDEMYTQIKSIVEDGGEVSADLVIDRKAGELSATLTAAGKQGSKLAANIENLGNVKSLGAALFSDKAALSGYAYAALPESIRTALAPVVDEAVELISSQAKRPAERDVAKQMLEALAPTAKAALLDGAVNLQGPSAAGKYTLVTCSKVQGGMNIEKALKKVVDFLPDEARQGIKLQIDREKVGGVNVHSFTALEVDQDFVRIFGEDATIYLALRDDALFVAMGDNAHAALKEALAVKEAPGKVLQARVSVSRVVQLAPDREADVARRVAKQVFGDNPEGDEVSLTVEGGKTLKIQVKMKAKLIELFAKVGEANREF